MSYVGDKRDQFPPGTRLGPTLEGVELEVIEAVYDETTNRTRLRTRSLELADRTLRFVGGSADSPTNHT